VILKSTSRSQRKTAIPAVALAAVMILALLWLVFSRLFQEPSHPAPPPPTVQTSGQTTAIKARLRVTFSDGRPTAWSPLVDFTAQP